MNTDELPNRKILFVACPGSVAAREFPHGSDGTIRRTEAEATKNLGNGAQTKIITTDVQADGCFFSLKNAWEVADFDPSVVFSNKGRKKRRKKGHSKTCSGSINADYQYPLCYSRRSKIKLQT